MLFSNTHLAKCEELYRLGLQSKRKTGNIVARGFADIGFEIFSCLPNNQVVSLLTGESLPLSADDKHLFSVPSCDELLDEIDVAGYSVVSLDKIESWSWKLKLLHDESDDTFEVSGDSLLDVLTEGLKGALLNVSG